MPFGSFNLPPIGAGAAFSAAGIDALLVLARLSGSDGDLCEDTDTNSVLIYRKPAGTTGVLIPSSWGSLATTLVSNASGSCYFDLTDDEDTSNTLTNRGWVVSTVTTGTETKVGGQPMTIDTGTTNNALSEVRFSGTFAPGESDDFLWVGKVESVNVGGTNSGNNRLQLSNGTKGIFISLDESDTTGNVSFFSSQNTPIGPANIVNGTTATWMAIFYSSSSDNPVCYNLTDATEFSAAKYSDLGASTGTYFRFLVYNSGGGASNQSQMKIHESWLFVV
jgi:hypothetical protein